MRPAAPPAQLNSRGGVAFRAAARLQGRGPRRAPASGRRRGRAQPAPLPRLRRGPCGAVPGALCQPAHGVAASLPSGAPCRPAHGAAASLPSGAPCRPAKGENANLPLSVNRGRGRDRRANPPLSENRGRGRTRRANPPLSAGGGRSRSHGPQGAPAQPGPAAAGRRNRRRRFALRAPSTPLQKIPQRVKNPLTLLFYDGRMKLNSKPLEPERSRIWNCPRKNYPMPSWT